MGAEKSYKQIRFNRMRWFADEGKEAFAGPWTNPLPQLKEGNNEVVIMIEEETFQILFTALTRVSCTMCC